MLKVTKVAPDRVDLELKGSIDGDEMRQGLDDLLRVSEGVENGRMLYRITDFAFPSLEAIGLEFTRLPKLFCLLGTFGPLTRSASSPTRSHRQSPGFVRGC